MSLKAVFKGKKAGTGIPAKVLPKTKLSLKKAGKIFKGLQLGKSKTLPVTPLKK